LVKGTLKYKKAHCEDICKLTSGKNVPKMYETIQEFWSDEVAIKFNMFCTLVKNGVFAREAKARYSVSKEDLEIVVFFLDFQEITKVPRKMQKLETECRVVAQEA